VFQPDGFEFLALEVGANQAGNQAKKDCDEKDHELPAHAADGGRSACADDEEGQGNDEQNQAGFVGIDGTGGKGKFGEGVFHEKVSFDFLVEKERMKTDGK
jgi:hypothetical protein